MVGVNIKEVLGMDNRGSYGLVSVILDDGTEAQVIVGGEVDVYFHKGTVKAHIKRNKGK